MEPGTLADRSDAGAGADGSTWVGAALGRGGRENGLPAYCATGCVHNSTRTLPYAVLRQVKIEGIPWRRGTGIEPARNVATRSTLDLKSRPGTSRGNPAEADFSVLRRAESGDLPKVNLKRLNFGLSRRDRGDVLYWLWIRIRSGMLRGS